MASKKKVVFVLPLLCAGGAERALITLANNLDRDLFEPHFVVLDDSGPLKGAISSDIPFHSLGRVRVSRSFFKLKKTLKVLKPDVVITTMMHSNVLLMSLKQFFPKTKFIIREAVVPSSILRERRWYSWLIVFLYRFFYHKADFVICPSEDIVNEFRTVLSMSVDRYQVLFNQVDKYALKSSLCDLNLAVWEAGVVRFVCVGRLSYQKGYDRLIEAIAGQLPRSFSWQLLILGEGEERGNLESLILRHGLSNHVRLLGNVDPPWSIMGGADCLLLPSRWEGMPNVVLESLACGTPVIASLDANGVKEIEQRGARGAVQIVDGMEEFVSCMRRVSIQGKVVASPSLLPADFEPSIVTKRFESLLLDLKTSH